MKTPDYSDLTSTLPNFINLGGLTEICRDLKEELEEDETPDSESWDNPELIEAHENLDHIYALLSGLYRAGVDVDSASTHSRILISSDHWMDYSRDIAEENFLGNGGDNPLANYIDWDRWSDDMLNDYTEVHVKRGEFAGSWYIRE